jgi:hypothetical protein
MYREQYVQILEVCPYVFTFWLLFAQEGPSIPLLIGLNLLKSLIHPCFFFLFSP